MERYDEEEYKTVSSEIHLDTVSTKVSKHCEFIYNSLEDMFNKDRVIKSYLSSIESRDYAIESYDIFMQIFDRLNNLDKEEINKSYIKTYTEEYLKHLLHRKKHDKLKQDKKDKQDYFKIKRFTAEENEIIENLWNTNGLSKDISFVQIVRDIIKKYIHEYYFEDDRLYKIVQSVDGDIRYIKKPKYYQKVELLKILLRKMYEYDEEESYE